MTDKKSLHSLLADNTAMLLLLGICPLLGATADVRAALGMAAVLIITTVVSVLVLSVLKRLIPQRAEIPAVFLVTAGVTSVVELLTHALFPSVYQLLGLYIAVLAVDLLLFALGRDVFSLRADKALGQSLRYALLITLVLLPVAALREVLGAGSFAGIEITALKDYQIPVFIQSAGGFMVLAFVAAVLNRTNGKPGTVNWFSAWADDFEEKSPEGEEGSAT